MQEIFKTNIGNPSAIGSVPGKVILVCFLLFSSFLVQAQNGKDTVSLIEELLADTVNEEKQIVDTAYEEKQVIEETQEIKENENEYFLKKSEYNSDSFLIRQRKVPDSLVKKMQEDDDFWYANAVIKKEKKKQKEDTDYVPLGQRDWFQTLVWLIIIGGFAAFLMIYLSGSNVGLFRKKNRVITAEEQEMITEDIFAINYQKEIDKAAAQGNYRLAVRLLFLRLLKNMSEKNIIHYKQDKTNLDYLLQLHPTHYYKNFFRITRNYEYSWYGQFEVSEEAYRVIRNDFDHFEKELH